LAQQQQQQRRQQWLFPSFFGAGFESAYHKKPGGERVDSVAATGHDRFLSEDHRRIADVGLCVARENVRWHRFEPVPGCYEPEELLRTLRSADEVGLTCIWDLCHYGWPDGIDFWSDEMVERAGAYAGTVAQILADEGHERPFLVPVNEMNYFAWAGGDKGLMNPFAKDRAPEAKRQIVRCAVAMCRAIRAVLPEARLVHTEPVMHLVADRPEDEAEAEERRLGMYESWDMISGRVTPELGGEDDFLDILGVNYYANNQEVFGGPTLAPDDPRRRPLSAILREVWERYNRPLFLSETAEAGDRRAPWLAHVSEECAVAISEGIPVEGITLYPVLDYPEWQSGEPMIMGLWGAPDAEGHRPIYEPLLEELRHQKPIMDAVRAGLELRDTDTALGYSPALSRL
jgi:beta-glucosidase/6-phospho-beta-glucosidase/beta-galactosidase